MTARIDIADIAPQQYAEWRNHPVTLFMFQHMRDVAEAIELKMLADWRSGQAKLSDETEARGRTMLLRELPDLKWESIQTFYGIEPEEKQNQMSDEGNDIVGNFRSLNSESIQFQRKPWGKRNRCGMRPIGDMVLILIDEAVAKSEGGIIIPEAVLAIRQMTAETGTIVAMGGGAFYWNSERSRPFVGDDKPKIGDHIMFSRYAGREVNGNDGNMYRLMLDKEIGGIAEDDGFTVTQYNRK